ncbi:hypothetical protein OROMI_016150 [Orobanche minor]
MGESDEPPTTFSFFPNYRSELSQAEFAHDLAINRSFGFCPFEVVYAVVPRGPLDLLTLPSHRGPDVRAADLIEQLHLVWVVLMKDRFPAREYNKLSACKIGPVETIEKINPNACRLKLPRDIHTAHVFNVKHLILFAGDDDVGDETTHDSWAYRSQPGEDDGDRPLDHARELALALPGMFPNSISPLLLLAAVHVRENKANRAEEILLQFANRFPDRSNVILLARAQIAASAGHPQIAAESLLKIHDIQHKPATVATIVSLKERAGDIDGADAVFDSAIQWWSNAMTEDNDSKRDIIMQEAASFKLRHGKKEEAARLYEELVRRNNSVEALVGLIRTTAHTDVEKAESYEKQLKALPGLKGIDVESLEKTYGAKHVENGVSMGVSEAYEAKNKEKNKKKRKRKSKYPKGFDPANPGPPPDPERWLPKRERSSYRPKRKDKRAAQVRGSQGAVAKEAASNANSKANVNSKEISQNASTERTKRSLNSRKKLRK